MRALFLHVLPIVMLIAYTLHISLGHTICA